MEADDIADARNHEVGEQTVNGSVFNATRVPMSFNEVGYAAMRHFLSRMTRHFMHDLESVRKELSSTHGRVVELETFFHTIRAQQMDSAMRAELR